MENTVTKPGFRKKFLGDKAFYKMVLAIAIPIMIQNGITNFVSLLDNIMIGRIGTEQMSGAAIVNQLLFVYNLCLFGGVSGAGIFTAQYAGQKDHEGVRQTFRYKLWLVIALTIITILILMCSGENLIRHVSERRRKCSSTGGYEQIWNAVSVDHVYWIAAIYDQSGILQYPSRMRRDCSAYEGGSYCSTCESCIQLSSYLW